MSTTGWHRRVLHSEGPTATAADRTIERTAIEAAGLGIYQLALVRRGLGDARRAPSPTSAAADAASAPATASAWTCTPARRSSSPRRTPSGRRERCASPSCRSRLAAWPRDDSGRPIRPGYNDSPSGRTVGPEQLRRLAATTDSAPAQTSLFG